MKTFMFIALMFMSFAFVGCTNNSSVFDGVEVDPLTVVDSTTVVDSVWLVPSDTL
jgi:ABC-type Zn uptake system ZnuABC Zn-binding protein ZnuA